MNCPDVGISCSLLPDEDYIRNIDIEVNSTHLVVTQSFTLNKVHSASIRDLVRYSMDSDIKLAEEAELFSNAICNNMNAIDVASSLNSFISVEQYSLNFSEMSCSVKEGLVLYPSSNEYHTFDMPSMSFLNINQRRQMGWLSVSKIIDSPQPVASQN